MQKSTVNKENEISCAICKARLETPVESTPEFSRCPYCDAGIRIINFPAVRKVFSRGQTAEPLVVDDEAGCFYHPGKKAVVPCSVCGRFLCALCDLEMSDGHICPPCLEARKNEDSPGSDLANQRTRYDKIALALAVYPMIPIFWFLTIMTAPVALYVVIRYWNTPVSIITPKKTSFVIAFILALVQVAGWVVFIYRFWI